MIMVHDSSTSLSSYSKWQARETKEMRALPRSDLGVLENLAIRRPPERTSENEMTCEFEQEECYFPSNPVVLSALYTGMLFIAMSVYLLVNNTWHGKMGELVSFLSNRRNANHEL